MTKPFKSFLARLLGFVVCGMLIGLARQTNVVQASVLWAVGAWTGHTYAPGTAAWTTCGGWLALERDWKGGGLTASDVRQRLLLLYDRGSAADPNEAPGLADGSRTLAAAWRAGLDVDSDTFRAASRQVDAACDDLRRRRGVR
jgi:hypothetical protein